MFKCTRYRHKVQVLGHLSSRGCHSQCSKHRVRVSTRILYNKTKFTLALIMMDGLIDYDDD